MTYESLIQNKNPILTSGNVTLTSDLGEAFNDAFVSALATSLGVLNSTNCSIPDDHIDPRRSSFFMARSVLRDIRSGVRTC